jgi:peptidoglycan hydrolase-like protein with peptidoglycan-binding domain
MKIEWRTGNHAYVGTLSVTAMLLALVITAFGAATASARTISPTPAQTHTLSALAAHGGAVNPGAGYGPYGSPVVRGLQALLANAGYPPGPLDGRYGPLTGRAVMRYQAALGLPATGIAGSQTLAALSARRVGLREGAGYPGGSPVVRHLQRLLVRAGSSPGPIDGLYGPRTARAVGQYQADLGLPVNGIAGPQTLTALAARGGAVLHPGAGFEAAGSPVVRHLQRLLSGAGYPPGPIDGRYGPLTERAVRRYQANHGLPVNGVVGPRIFAELRSNSGVRNSPGGRPSTAPAPTVTPPAGAAPTPTAPPRARPAGHPPGSISILWIVLLGLLAAGVCAGALRYRRERRSKSSIASLNEHPGPPAAAPTLRAEQPVEADQPTSGEPRATTEQLAVTGTNGAGRGDPSKTANGAGSGDPGDVDVVGRSPTRRRNGKRKAGDAGGALTNINEAFNLGVLLQQRDDLAGAEAAYRRADERGHAGAASNLGVLLEAQGDGTGAEAAYRRAAERGAANGAFNLGVLLEERDDFASAEAAYRRATECGDSDVAQLAQTALLDLARQGSRAGISAQS